MGRIFKRGKTLWGYWLDENGKRHRRSLRTADRTVARERLRDAELAATPQARRKPQRLSVAIEHMIVTTCHDKAEGTREMYREKGRRIIATLGDVDINDIDRDMLTGYIATRLSAEGKKPASPHTVQKELITIRRALREAVDRGLLKAMPAMPRFSPRYQPRETWLTPDQFERLAAELEPDRELWAALAALGGMRAGEVERLRWTMVDLETGRIKVPGTKTESSRRTVPIAPALLGRLDRAPGSGSAAPLPVVQPWGNVRRDLAAACKRAGVPRVSPNDLRRTFASWLVQQGVPPLTVATLMGHSSSRMVEKVYGKLSAEVLDTAVAKLPAASGLYTRRGGIVGLGTTPGHSGDKPEDESE